MGQIQRRSTSRKKYIMMLVLATTLTMSNSWVISAHSNKQVQETQEARTIEEGETVAEPFKEEQEQPEDVIILDGDEEHAIPQDTGGSADSMTESERAANTGKKTVKNAPQPSIKALTKPASVAAVSTKSPAVLMASFSTKVAPGHAGRTHNIKSSTKALHNIVLKPGETLKYSDVVRKTVKAYGLKKAPVIVGGKFVEGSGGGICQTSSTLYNAALLSGLEIVERRNHSLPVGYVGLGRDATYAGNSIEFAIRNNTDENITIQTKATNKNITIEIHGKKEKGVTYEIKTRVLKKIQPKVVYQKKNVSPSKQTRIIQKGKPGYIVEAKRIKKKNGVVVSEEMLTKSTYRAQNIIKG